MLLVPVFRTWSGARFSPLSGPCCSWPHVVFCLAEYLPVSAASEALEGEFSSIWSAAPVSSVMNMRPSADHPVWPPVCIKHLIHLFCLLFLRYHWNVLSITISSFQSGCKYSADNSLNTVIFSAKSAVPLLGLVDCDRLLITWVSFLTNASHILTSSQSWFHLIVVKFLGCQLTGKVFYKVEDKCYCEADYLVSHWQLSIINIALIHLNICLQVRMKIQKLTLFPIRSLQILVLTYLENVINLPRTWVNLVKFEYGTFSVQS